MNGWMDHVLRPFPSFFLPSSFLGGWRSVTSPSAPCAYRSQEGPLFLFPPQSPCHHCSSFYDPTNFSAFPADCPPFLFVPRFITMTSPIDWAPYASDGEQFRIVPPMGIPYSLATDDIYKARPTPSTKTYLHGEVGDKMFPDIWLPRRPPVKYRSVETCRIVNPLEPQYKLPSGKCLIPCGDVIPFSKRVTDLLDTSDIPGTKPTSMSKSISRASHITSDYIDDAGFHPTKRTHTRNRTAFGQGLDLFDIDIGKRQFGFKRKIISNPLEPRYTHASQESLDRNANWMKKKVLPPHRDEKGSLDKILDKIYGKIDMLPLICGKFDPDNTQRISYENFRKSLEAFGVHLSEKELNEVVFYTDREQAGHVRYKKFAKFLRNAENWERTFPRRLGADLGCPSTDANLGQGLQVLVEYKPKTKIPFKTGLHQSFPYDFFTGEPLAAVLPTIPNRESLSLSYAEQAAFASKQRHESGIIGTTTPYPRKLCPIQRPDRSKIVKSTSPISAEIEPSLVAQPSSEALTGADAVSGQESCHKNQTNGEGQPFRSQSEGNGQNSSIIATMYKPKVRLMAPNKAMYPKADNQILDYPRIAKFKRTVPMAFKQRLYKEQHSADLHAVQFLT